MLTRAFILNAICFTLALAQPNFWRQSKGIEGGYASAISHYRGKTLVGTYGGLFLTSDTGATWRHVGPFDREVTDITIAGPHLFASTAEGEVFRSDDEGESWTSRSAGLPGGEVFTLASLGFSIFGGTYHGCYRSTDFGESWVRSDAGMSNREVRFLFTSGPALIATSFGGSGAVLYRSTDIGQTWIAVDAQSWTPDIATETGGILYGAGYQNQGKIRLSTDHGLTWSLPPFAAAPDDIITALYADNTGIYAGTGGDGIFRCQDQEGLYWSGISNGLLDRTIAALEGFPGYLFAGSYSGISVSSNSGGNWRLANNGLMNARVTAIVSLGDTLLASAWGVGTLFSVDNGISWRACPSSPGLYVFDLCMLGSRLVAITMDKMQASTNRGATWFKWGASLPYGAKSLSANSRYVFAATEAGIYRSTIDAATWTKVLDGRFLRYRSVVAYETGVVVALGYGMPVKRSMDDGTTWADGSAPRAPEVIADVGGILYGGRREVNEIYRSADSGLTWQRLDVPLEGSDVIQITGEGNFVAAGLSNDAGVIASFDAGSTWQHYNFGLLNMDITTLHYHNGVLNAGTGGNSSFRVNVATPELPTDYLVLPERGARGVGTTLQLAWTTLHGALYYTLQMSKSPRFDSLTINETRISHPFRTINDLETSTVYYWRVRGEGPYGYSMSWVTASFRTRPPTFYVLNQNYPNPFNSQTRISFSLPAPAITTVRIYNVLGQRLSTLFEGFLEDGPHDVVWDAGRFSTGTYFYTLETDNFFQAKKMILVK